MSDISKPPAVIPPLPGFDDGPERSEYYYSAAKFFPTGVAVMAFARGMRKQKPFGGQMFNFQRLET